MASIRKRTNPKPGLSPRVGDPSVTVPEDELELIIGAEIVDMTRVSLSCMGVRERPRKCEMRLPYDEEDVPLIFSVPLSLSERLSCDWAEASEYEPEPKLGPADGKGDC